MLSKKRLFMKSQLRKHLEYKDKHKRRLEKQKNRLGSCGDHVWIDKNVKLMRFPENIHLGDHLVLKEGAKICSCNEQAQVSIGDNTTFGYHSFLFSSESISIGADCLIAPFVYIVDSDHSIELGTKINQQPNQTSPIVIGDDVWIGTGAKILKGVTIGDGAVIAAGAIVMSDVPSNKIYGGIPAKEIAERK